MPAGRAVSERSLADYARNLVDAAQALPRDGLISHRLRLPLLDIDGWFAEAALPKLCTERLVAREDDAPAQSRIDLFALDPTLPGWDVPALWHPETDFNMRAFDAAFARAGLRGYHYQNPSHAAPSWQVHDPELATGLLSLPEPMGIPPWENGSPLRLFLHWAYARQGARLTHAATLGIDGTGAILVGAGGSGKSGTTLAGLLHGLQSAGDDYVMLEQGDDVMAHAVYRTFKQDPQGLRRAGLDPQRLGAPQLNWQGKHEFNAEALRPAAFVRRLKIKAILVPEIAHLQKTQVEPYSAGNAALALAPSAVLQFPGDAESGFRFFAGITRRLPAYKLRLSEDPREIADAIGRLLQNEVARAS